MLMRKMLPLIIAVCIMFAAWPATAGETREQPSSILAQLQKGINALAERATPATVTIVFPNNLGNASGVIVDADGHIVTNYHVVSMFEGEAFTILLHDKRRLTGYVIGTDEPSDIALIAVTGVNAPLPAIVWGDSDSVKVGDLVFAIGTPFLISVAGSVTQGIVSGLHRNLDKSPYDDFIQTDASVSRGNSGGPLLNINGEVIGINKSIFSRDGGSIGIGFAIPSNFVREIAAQLLLHGRVKRGVIGIQVENVTLEIAAGAGLQETLGARVTGIVEGGAAARAGIREGDIILSWDGTPIREIRELSRIAVHSEVGRAVPVLLWRNGEKITLLVTPDVMEERSEPSSEYDSVPPGALAPEE